MKFLPTRKAPLSYTTLALLVVATYWLWSHFANRHHWKEEVQLQNGELLTVDRSIQFEFDRPIGGVGGSDVIESTLEISSPNRKDSPPQWRHPPFLPLVFDRDPDNNEWFIVATFYMCTDWYSLGRPKLPYTEFRYRNGTWIQLPLSEKLIGREGNILVPNGRDAGPDYSLQMKRDKLSDPRVSPEYKSIVRAWKTYC